MGQCAKDVTKKDSCWCALSEWIFRRKHIKSINSKNPLLLRYSWDWKFWHNYTTFICHKLSCPVLWLVSSCDKTPMIIKICMGLWLVMQDLCVSIYKRYPVCNNLLLYINDGIYAEFQSIDVDLDSRKFCPSQTHKKSKHDWTFLSIDFFFFVHWQNWNIKHFSRFVSQTKNKEII